LQVNQDGGLRYENPPYALFSPRTKAVVAIGRKCTNVSEAEAMDYVFGYMNFIDGSVRGLGPPANVFFQMKSRDTFAPIGPWLVTSDEIKDPLKLQIRLWNNGVLMQNFNTDDMGHKIAKCIAWLSSIHTLLPGDIVATGTNHRGLNPFMDGDTIELETEGLGRLKFGIKDDLKRTWARKTRLQMHEEAKEKTAGLYPDLTPQLTGKYAK
jgi:2-keto-4-pentenoate hydratase/2-oxohepta-3-ene-1,7-dioic acid hydratase in catechol pathway